MLKGTNVSTEGITAYGDEILTLADIVSEERLAHYIMQATLDMFSNLNVSPKTTRNISSFCVDTAKTVDNLLSYERAVRSFLEESSIFPDFYSTIKGRAERMCKLTRPCLKRGSVLDLGCGSGDVGKEVYDQGYEVTLADVIKNSKVDSVGLPFVKIRQHENLPFEEESFDNILVFAMLHHTEDPFNTLDNVQRILKPEGRLHLIETVYGIHESIDRGNYYGVDESNFVCLSTEEQRKVTMFFDYFGNHVTWFYTENPEESVPIPFNFTTPARLSHELKQRGFEIVKYQPLGIDPASQVYHVHYVLEKNS